MHYSFDGGSDEYYFSTDRRSKKFRNAAERPLGSIVVGWSEDDWITVQVSGSLIIADTSNIGHAQEVHYNTNPSSAAFKDDPNTAFLILRPIWIRYSDLGVGPDAIWEWSRYEQP